jgi:hypothetical protein
MATGGASVAYEVLWYTVIGFLWRNDRHPNAFAARGADCRLLCLVPASRAGAKSAGRGASLSSWR